MSAPRLHPVMQAALQPLTRNLPKAEPCIGCDGEYVATGPDGWCDECRHIAAIENIPTACPHEVARLRSLMVPRSAATLREALTDLAVALEYAGEHGQSIEAGNAAYLAQIARDALAKAGES